MKEVDTMKHPTTGTDGRDLSKSIGVSDRPSLSLSRTSNSNSQGDTFQRESEIVFNISQI
jgi:hypothetical protein